MGPIDASSSLVGVKDISGTDASFNTLTVLNNIHTDKLNTTGNAFLKENQRVSIIIDVDSDDAPRLGVNRKLDTLSQYQLDVDGQAKITGELQLGGALFVEEIQLTDTGVGKGEFYIHNTGDISANDVSFNELYVLNNIDGSGDLTMGTITMTGFSVDVDGDTVTKSINNTSGGITNTGAISGATNIDGSGDLTMGTITMTDFSVDANGNVSSKSIDNNNGGITNAGGIAGATDIDGTGDLTMEP